MQKYFLYFITIITSVFIFGCSASKDKDVKTTEIDKKALIEGLSSKEYKTRTAILSKLILYGVKNPLSKEFVDVLLVQLNQEKDWAIKVRIISALGQAADKEAVIPTLIRCLSDREDESSGSGNVPVSAARVLSEIGNPKAIAPLQDWIEYLKNNPYKEMEFKGRNYNEDLLKLSTKYLKVLEEKCKGQNSATESTKENDGIEK